METKELHCCPVCYCKSIQYPDSGRIGCSNLECGMGRARILPKDWERICMTQNDFKAKLVERITITKNKILEELKKEPHSYQDVVDSSVINGLNYCLSIIRTMQ